MKNIIQIVVTLLLLLFSSGSYANEFIVEKYVASRASNGNTVLSYNGNKKKPPKIVEVDMNGNTVWEYIIPKKLIKNKKSIVMDVERLDNNNTLFNLKNSGIFEVNKSGKIVWQYLDSGSSHDVDRLDNGNTIWVRAWVEQGEPHVIEVNSRGETVWKWDGLSNLDIYPYSMVDREGWMHVNAVTRMKNGHTILSLRNLQMVIELDLKDNIVWRQTFDCYKAGELWEISHMDSPEGCNPHEPEISSDNTMLVAVRDPHAVYLLDISSGKLLWEWWGDTSERIRDVDRLQNGNVLIQDNNKLIEVTPNKEVVWILKAKGLAWSKDDIRAGKALYKAQRLH